MLLHQREGVTVSRYEALWEHVRTCGQPSLRMTFEEIQAVVGMPLNHAFLQDKKELLAYGYRVGKISMKQRTVDFVITD